jgi:hypothetical protein
MRITFAFDYQDIWTGYNSMFRYNSAVNGNVLIILD